MRWSCHLQRRSCGFNAFHQDCLQVSRFSPGKYPGNFLICCCCCCCCCFSENGLGDVPLGNPPELFLDLTDYLLTEGKLHLLTNQYEQGVISDRIMQPEETPGAGYANNALTESFILMHRALTNIFRVPELFMARLSASVFFGILLGTLFLFTENNQKGYAHRLSYFVFTIAFYYYTSLEALPIFLHEREIFQREFSRGAYRAGSYTIATLLVQFPFHLILSFVFNCITWWLVGCANDAGVFFFQVLCVFTVIVAGNVFATMFSVLVPNPMVGQSAGSGLFSVMFLFSGFFIKKSEIPRYWLWLHYSSLFKYAYDSMMVNAFKDHASTAGEPSSRPSVRPSPSLSTSFLRAPPL